MRRARVWMCSVFLAFGLWAASSQPASVAAKRQAGRSSRNTGELSVPVPRDMKLVFTQSPVPTGVESHHDSLPGDGARLVLLNKDRRRVVLTPQFQSAVDPAVSFDGKRILFAGKKKTADLWNIYEMNADGTGLKQITREMGNCRNPLYQPAVFYLNDPKPSYQITFVSDAAGEMDERGSSLATNLYSIRMDGSGLRRLTYGISASSDPAQMPDGRIVFSHWQRDPGEPSQGRVDLFGVSLDGTDFAAFSGPQGMQIKRMATATTTRSLIFVESDDPNSDGGSLATVALRRNLHSYRALTTSEDGLFYSPSALPGGSILVSNRPANQRHATYSIFRFDPDTRQRTLLFSDPRYDNVQAVALVAHGEPDGHSSVVEDDQPWSKLYCLTVHQSDLGEKWTKATHGWRLRIIEALPRTKGAAVADRERDTLSGLVQTRVLGETKLDDDGSFHLSIPPNLPVQLQLVDTDGIAVRASAWFWTKNKEQRGCIGCHEDGELTPENVFPQALSHPAAQLMLPPQRRRTVDFRRDVLPIFAAKCAACHDANRSPRLEASDNDAKTVFEEVYRPLLQSASSGKSPTSHARYIDPGRARTSVLVWSIMGKTTARPWDCVAPVSVKQMPPPGAAQLTEEEREAIFEWIDMGAQFNALPTRKSSTATSGSDGGQR
jgi:Hydrazine synthase alpha subunit middle domain